MEHTTSWLAYLASLLTSPLSLIITVFQIWMIVHALRNGEYLWAALIFFFPLFGGLIYFFNRYQGAPSSSSGFELPGAVDRRRIAQLKRDIHFLDKAHHHLALGDIYFQQGNYSEAEKCYKAAYERDPKDLEVQSHYGQCLARLKRPTEARPLLESVCKANPKHEYGYTLMALAETLMQLGENDWAIKYWEYVLASHSYSRAQTQLAALLIGKKEYARATELLESVIRDAAYLGAGQRRKERVWVNKAKALLNDIPREFLKSAP